MSPTASNELLALYHEAEQRYLEALPLEHFMEATDHAWQRKITVESFDLITAVWPAFQVFNELLVQYPLEDVRRPVQVVPDNFVVVHDQPIRAVGSFNTPFQPVRPFLVLEYVSTHNKRKDYVDNFQKYERELKVPYYLLYYPGNRELTIYRLTADGYEEVMENRAGRLAIPELFLEAAVVDDWVRYWFKGELLALPGELAEQLDDLKQQLKSAELDAMIERKARESVERRAVAAEARAAAAEEELAKLLADLARAQRN